MKQAKTKKAVVLGVIGALVMASLLLVPVDPAMARTSFQFGLNLGVPVTPYPAYTYPYPPPPYYRYQPVPYYQVYPPCARVWTPGYYDGYGNWVFGYYRYDCNHYGY